MNSSRYLSAHRAYLYTDGSVQTHTHSPPSTASDFNSTLNPKHLAIPRELLFNDDSLVSVISYSVLFFIAAVGNLTIFITLFRNRHRKSRVNMFIMHLSIADLIVTFVMLPLETAWHVTVAWRAGDAACRILMFFRAFGFYLSSFVLVTISLDRYFAFVHPLSLTDAGQRGRLMLTLAWIFSTIASLPQSFIFHLEKHPHFSWYSQCVTFNFFPTPGHELAYNLFHAVAVYGLPLLIIITAYSAILCEMGKKTREHSEMKSLCNENLLTTMPRSRLRRSSIANIRKARMRTLKMTIVIVVVFVTCWTPYFIISAWWWFDRESAVTLDPKIQRGLFIFAVSNSCMDPIVYGMFSIDLKREIRRCCCYFTLRMDRRASIQRPLQRPPTHTSSSGYSGKCFVSFRVRKSQSSNDNRRALSLHDITHNHANGARSQRRVTYTDLLMISRTTMNDFTTI